jgi:hypothetical protein
MDQSDPKMQTALAMAALAAAFAETLTRLFPKADEEPLVILQRQVQVQCAKLRETPNADDALEIFRFVREALRNPQILSQPD